MGAVRRGSEPGVAEREKLEAAKIAKLTNREREVIAVIGDGLKNKQIAVRLSISEETVRRHLTSIYSKLDVSDRLELVIYAYRYGLAKLPNGEEDWPNAV